MSLRNNLALASTENLPAVSEAEHLARRRWLSKVSLNTERLYKRALRDFLAVCGAESIAEACATPVLAEKNLVAFENSMAEKSAATRQACLSAIRSLLRHCAARGVCPRVTRLVPKCRQAEKLPLTCPTEEQCRIAINLEPDPEGKLLMRLLYGTALRISEALSLRFDNFILHPDGQLVLWLVGKGEKACLMEICPAENVECGKLLRRLGAQLVEEAEKYDWQGPVFRFRDQSRAYLLLRKAWKRAGVTEITDILGNFAHYPGCHDWRRCHITHVQNAGATRGQARIQARHSREDTTGRYTLRAPENPGRLLGRG